MNQIQSVIASSVVFFMCSSSFGQTTDLEVGLAAGTYLGAVDLLEKMSESPCGYAINKEYSLSEATDVVLNHLSSPMKSEVDSYINGPEGQAKFKENDAFISGFLSASEKDGIDEKTACGMLITNAALLRNNAAKDWSDMLFNYDQGNFKCQVNTALKGNSQGFLSEDERLTSFVLGEFTVDRQTGLIEGFLSRVQEHGTTEVLPSEGIFQGSFYVLTQGSSPDSVSYLNISHSSPDNSPSFKLFDAPSSFYVGSCEVY